MTCPVCGRKLEEGQNFCPSCGYRIRKSESPAETGNEVQQLPSETGSRAQQAAAENRRQAQFFRTEPDSSLREKKLLGTLFAFLGTIPGLACQLVLARIGFIATISSVIGFAGASRCYRKFGKKLSRYGVVICLIATFLMILAGEHLNLAIDLYQAAGEWYINGEADYRFSFAESFLFAPFLLGDRELLAAVLKDLLFAVGFAVLGCWQTVAAVWREGASASRQQNVTQRYSAWNRETVTGTVTQPDAEIQAQPAAEMETQPDGETEAVPVTVQEGGTAETSPEKPAADTE